MKKSLLALAVLGAFAGAASAQSSVTVYGKLNVEVGKAVGSADKALMDIAGSRLGFKGVEDLGGGMAATFGIEHRFNPATGADATGGTKFWNGYSTVGIQGGFGHIRVGRDYAPAFLMIQNQIDPAGGDTVAATRDVGMRTVGKVRYNNMVEYHLSASGFNLGAQIAETNANAASEHRPVGLAANYAAGPLFAGFGYEDTGAIAKQWNVGARYNLGFATLAGGLPRGKNTANQDANGWLLGATVPAGAGDFRVAYAQKKVNDVTTNAKLGLGYHYNLSKRTKVFVDYARDSKVLVEKTGYDVGVQHNF